MATKKRPTLKAIAKAVDGKTRDEIKQYFVENNIIDTPHIKHSDIAVVGELIIRDACMDEDGKFHYDSTSVDVFVAVWQFYLSTHVDMTGMTFEDAYDVITWYDLNSIVDELAYRQASECTVFNYTYDAIGDIRDNDASATALLAKITAAINDITKQAQTLIATNPDAVKQIVDNTKA